MRILIVGRDPSDASYLEDLRAIWQGHDIQTVTISDFTAERLADCDLLAISGQYGGDVAVPLEPLSALTNIILDPALPVLAIGWGFEIACLAFGDDLPETAEKVEGAIRIEPTSKGENLFQGSDPIRVNPGPRWNVEEVPRGIAVLARSETGIEAFQHKAKPVLALQLLPADFTYATDGKLVYHNLLGSFGKRG